ncbi:MAG: hypothetical protein Q9191_003301 [Dirinaria sp. TL-2023a]
MATQLTPAQQKQLDYEQAHPTEFGCSGLITFTIIGIVIIAFAVGLRFWSRTLAKIPLHADDYLLLVGMQWYAFSLMYTTSFPIARISLTLLYKRIFIQARIRWICWFLVFCYTGYAIGSSFADIFQFNPIASAWDLNVKRTHSINLKALYLANTGFNISTDFILLILPLAGIWTLRMTPWRKTGLGLIFCLGCLTVIASILRLVLYYSYNTLDPNYALAPIQWWTHAEMDLGILCPCFVTMQPLLRHGFVYFSSQLSPLNRSRAERFTGVSTSNPPRPKLQNGEAASSHAQISSAKFHSDKSLRSKYSRMEDGTQGYDMEDLSSHAIPTKDSTGMKGAEIMPMGQETALAK